MNTISFVLHAVKFVLMFDAGLHRTYIRNQGEQERKFKEIQARADQSAVQLRAADGEVMKFQKDCLFFLLNRVRLEMTDSNATWSRL